MRKFHVILGLLLLPLAVQAVDFRPVISREAGKYARAWQRSDCEAILSYLPPRVIQQMGGRAAVLVELKDRLAQAREWGATALEATPGQPSIPKQTGRWLASMLPTTAVVHGTHLDLTQQTHVLALSADRGKSWFFLVLYEVTQAELNTWFPEFRGKIVVPTPPAPQLKIVY